MVNYAGNPNIAEAGRATRFGTGQHPQAALKKGGGNKPWSMRKTARYLLARTIEMDASDSMAERQRKLHDGLIPPGESLTLQQLLVAQLILKAIAGSTQAMQCVTDLSDGKLTAERLEAYTTLEEQVVGGASSDGGREVEQAE